MDSGRSSYETAAEDAELRNTKTETISFVSGF